MMKTILAALWLLILANFLVPFTGEYLPWLNRLGIVLLVAHTIEYFVFAKQIKAKGDGTAKSLLMTLLFGLAYIRA